MIYIQTMKMDATKQGQRKPLEITVDPRLNELFDGKVLFPEKLAQANEFIAKHPLPERLKKKKV